MDEIQKKIESGANFDDLIKEYGEDPGMESSPDGYVFTEGEMVDEFYQGTKALKAGEISEPVNSSYGIHIIQRVELTDDDFANYEGNVKSTLMSERFVEQLEQYKDDADVKTTSAYNKIDVAAVLERYEADYEEASKVIEEEYAKMQEEASKQEETDGEETQTEESQEETGDDKSAETDTSSEPEETGTSEETAAE